jgi:hypothetical protein
MRSVRCFTSPVQVFHMLGWAPSLPNDIISKSAFATHVVSLCFASVVNRVAELVGHFLRMTNF